ncbi:pyrroline-5-carboxylate reductase [Buchananella felis]|uniref:pyrroline-5-carboxylate reductase n=1 Tax=Buchananella felis TaxID=3231492 RepID=UPI003526CD20
MRIGFIGCGAMGGAIARGAVAAGLVDGGQMLLYDSYLPSAEALAGELGAQVASGAADVAGGADLLVLAVKPNVIEAVLADVASHLDQTLVVSIAAGIPLARLEAASRAGGSGEVARVVRAMPNLAASVGQAMTGLALGTRVSEPEAEPVRALFEAVGRVAMVPESLFSPFVAMAGSSPAFALEYADSLARAGVAAGLTKRAALEYAAQAMRGAAELLLSELDKQGGRSAADLIDAVCSPGGTTVAGMMALDGAGFRAATEAAVAATIARDRELAG